MRSRAVAVFILLFALLATCTPKQHPASTPHPFRDAPPVLVDNPQPKDGTTVGQ